MRGTEIKGLDADEDENGADAGSLLIGTYDEAKEGEAPSHSAGGISITEAGHDRSQGSRIRVKLV